MTSIEVTHTIRGMLLVGGVLFYSLFGYALWTGTYFCVPRFMTEAEVAQAQDSANEFRATLAEIKNRKEKENKRSGY